jgi:hypothetical protein
MASINPTEGATALREVSGVLDAAGIRYWLGRGLFRHFTLHHEFGDKQGDVDLHVLREDEDSVRDEVKRLEGMDYEVVSRPEHTHKITLRRGETEVEVELVFLNRDGEVLWHQAGLPDRRRYDCPARAFGERRLEMFGILVRVPDEEYLPAVFGPGWEANEKETGGAPIG